MSNIIDNEINDEDELFNDDILDNESDLLNDVILDDSIDKESKHKEKGKHALKYDSIFKGKKDEDPFDEHFIEDIQNSNSFQLDAGSTYSFERESPVEYTRIKNLKMSLYTIISDVLKLNLKNSRRKPSKVDFNKNYGIIVSHLDMKTFTYSEVFLEFAFYFSDNIENMFKLLDKKWGSKISNELAQKGNIKGGRNLEDIDFI